MTSSEELQIEIPCPTCGRRTRKPLSWLLLNRRFECECGQRIEISDDDIRALKEQLERQAR